MDYTEIIRMLQECSHMIDEILNYVTISFKPAALKAQSFKTEPVSDSAVIGSPFLDDSYTSMNRLNDCIKPVAEMLSLNIKPTKEQIEDLLNQINVVINQLTGCWNGASAVHLADHLRCIVGCISRLL